MSINSGIECRCCKYDSEKRVVIKRNPLQKVVIIFPNGYEEFCCNNIIKTRRIWIKRGRGKSIYKWITENCRNHILVKKVKV